MHRAPDFAEKGEPGEEKWVILELKLLADVGLIGLPNAGKSTLLSRMTAARPKIADYPFTTLAPNLGVVDLGPGEGINFVIADIPGLIEGAHEGQGLGHEFLRHVERTRLLVHVIDMSGAENNPLEGFMIINKELAKYKKDLSKKPQIIAANKIDLPSAKEQLEKCRPVLEQQGYKVIPVSAVTGQGIKELIFCINQLLKQIPKVVATEDIKEYRVEEEEPFKIEKRKDVFYVSGKVVERLVAMTDLGNESAVKRLQHTFKRIGLDDALKMQKIKPGDLVKIGESEFYYVE